MYRCWPTVAEALCNDRDQHLCYHQAPDGPTTCSHSSESPGHCTIEMVLAQMLFGELVLAEI